MQKVPDPVWITDDLVPKDKIYCFDPNVLKKPKVTRMSFAETKEVFMEVDDIKKMITVYGRAINHMGYDLRIDNWESVAKRS